MAAPRPRPPVQPRNFGRAGDTARQRSVLTMTPTQRALYEVFENDIREWKVTGIPPVGFCSKCDCGKLHGLRERMEHVVEIMCAEVKRQHHDFMSQCRIEYPQHLPTPMPTGVEQLSEPARVGLELYIGHIMRLGGSMSRTLEIQERLDLRRLWQDRGTGVTLTMAPRGLTEKYTISSQKPGILNQQCELVHK